MLISDDYRNLIADLNKRYPDKRTRYWRLMVEEIRSLIKGQGLASVLDYGCSKGAPLSLLLGPIVRSYDPAIEEYASPPEPADLVVCTYVLEHVEPDCLDAVLDHLRALTRRLVFIIVPSYKSGMRLKDGRNAHLTQEKWGWWGPRILKRFDCLKVEERASAFSFLGKPLLL